MNELDVAVVGNVGIDTSIFLHGEPSFAVESNYTQNLDYVGQSGGYSTRGFAQLGRRTAFIGSVGADFAGDFIRREFSADGIDLDGLFIDPAGSGRSINLIYPGGRRVNFYDGKSHMTLAPDLSRCREILSRAKLVLFSIPNWARRLLPIARELNLPVACDLQDLTDLYDPYRRDFIVGADVLFFSSVNFPSPQPIMEAILREFPEKLLISGMGARGCAAADRNGVRFFSAVELPPPIVDATGAGDGLAVGFLTSCFLEGKSLEDSILRGQIVARWTCAQKASTSNLITRRQLESFYEQLK